FVDAPITRSQGDAKCFHSVCSTTRKRPSEIQRRKIINIHSFLMRFHEYHESEIEKEVPTILSVRSMYATKTTVRKIAIPSIISVDVRVDVEFNRAHEQGQFQEVHAAG